MRPKARPAGCTFRRGDAFFVVMRVVEHDSVGFRYVDQFVLIATFRYESEREFNERILPSIY